MYRANHTIKERSVLDVTAVVRRDEFTSKVSGMSHKRDLIAVDVIMLEVNQDKSFIDRLD